MPKVRIGTSLEGSASVRRCRASRKYSRGISRNSGGKPGRAKYASDNAAMPSPASGAATYDGSLPPVSSNQKDRAHRTLWMGEEQRSTNTGVSRAQNLCGKARHHRADSFGLVKGGPRMADRCGGADTTGWSRRTSEPIADSRRTRGSRAGRFRGTGSRRRKRFARSSRSSTRSERGGPPSADPRREAGRALLMFARAAALRANFKKGPRVRLDMIRFRDGAEAASESPPVHPSAATYGEPDLRRTGPE